MRCAVQKRLKVVESRKEKSASIFFISRRVVTAMCCIKKKKVERGKKQKCKTFKDRFIVMRTSHRFSFYAKLSTLY